MVVAFVACSGGTGKARATPPPADPERPTAVVTSSIVLDQCAPAKQVDPVKAGKEIETMVARCKSIPGGRAHFSATLMPDGQVQLGDPEGNPAAGMIPTCLLQAKGALKHKLRMPQPCKFDVRLEESTNGAP